MRIRRYTIGLRELHVLLNRGVNLPDAITVPTSTLPSGAVVRHCLMSPGALGVDVFVEHESFDEVREGEMPPSVQGGCFDFMLATVIKSESNLVILDNLNTSALIQLRNEIDKRLGTHYNVDPAKMDDIKSLAEELCKSLGIPKRVFNPHPQPGTRLDEFKVGDMVILKYNPTGHPPMLVKDVPNNPFHDHIICQWTLPTGLVKAEYFSRDRLRHHQQGYDEPIEPLMPEPDVVQVKQ